MAIKVVTPPAVEPVSTSEAKAHCRVDISDDDTLIGSLIVGARAYVEAFVNRAMVTQTLELVLDRFPMGNTLALPMPPLQSVTSVTYYDESGTGATLSSSQYLVDTDSHPGWIVLKDGYTWPSTTLQAANGVRIRFVAGYGLAASVPQMYKQAILMMVGHYYENREAAVVGSGLVVMELPLAVRNLLWFDRVKRF